MSRVPCPIDGCDLPARSGLMCGACQAELQRALDGVPTLVDDLHVTLSRQTSRTTGGRSAAVPLPYDARASEAAWVLRSALVGWVRQLQEAQPEEWPSDTAQAMARWLSARLSRILSHPAASEAHGEITGAVRAAQRVVDRPQGYVYAGPCTGCETSLHVRPAATRTTCRECGTEVKVADRREWMRARCEDLLGPAAYVATVCTGLGYPLSESTVRMWVKRKHLSPHSYQAPRGDEAAKEGRRRPVYRVGDVIRVWTGEIRRYTA